MKENKSNGLDDIISQAIEEMKLEQGNHQLLGLPGTASVCGIFRRADNG